MLFRSYTAYVSGVAPQLDSISVFNKIEYRDREITNNIDCIIKVPSNKRWGIGISAGYGFSRDGPSPYIGIGISYNVFRF